MSAHRPLRCNPRMTAGLAHGWSPHSLAAPAPEKQLELSTGGNAHSLYDLSALKHLADRPPLTSAFSRPEESGLITKALGSQAARA